MARAGKHQVVVARARRGMQKSSGREKKRRQATLVRATYFSTFDPVVFVVVRLAPSLSPHAPLRSVLVLWATAWAPQGDSRAF